MSTPESITKAIRISIKRRRRYIMAFRDRHGSMRYYYRKRGCPLVALSGEPGSEKFIASYHAAEIQTGAHQGPRQGFVYAIQVRGFDLVKIGFAASPSKRLIDLESGSGMQGGLVLLTSFPGDDALERLLHKHFAEQRLFGEWFRLSGAISLWLADLATEGANAA